MAVWQSVQRLLVQLALTCAAEPSVVSLWQPAQVTDPAEEAVCAVFRAPEWQLEQAWPPA